MNYLNKYVLVAADVTAAPKQMAVFRGKTAKEAYRFSKGVILTGSLKGPAVYAISAIPKEMSKGFIYAAVGQVGETTIGYVCGIGFVRWIYKVVQVKSLKAAARIIYNVACLPITIYFNGVDAAFEVLQISKLEKFWFGEPVYIFNDKRLWVESNFTLDDAIKGVLGDKEE